MTRKKNPKKSYNQIIILIIIFILGLIIISFILNNKKDNNSNLDSKEYVKEHFRELVSESLETDGYEIISVGHYGEDVINKSYVF